MVKFIKFKCLRVILWKKVLKYREALIICISAIICAYIIVFLFLNNLIN